MPSLGIRISRCNRVAATSIELLRINMQTGKLVDTPAMYRITPFKTP